MKTLDMNRIIAWGLVIMGVLAISGWIAYTIIYGNSGGTEIPLAISSGLLGVITGRNLTSKERDKDENIH